MFNSTVFPLCVFSYRDQIHVSIRSFVSLYWFTGTDIGIQVKGSTAKKGQTDVSNAYYIRICMATISVQRQETDIHVRTHINMNLVYVWVSNHQQSSFICLFFLYLCSWVVFPTLTVIIYLSNSNEIKVYIYLLKIW